MIDNWLLNFCKFLTFCQLVIFGIDIGLKYVSCFYLFLQLGLFAPTQLAGHPNWIWAHPDPKAQFHHSKKTKQNKTIK